MTRVLRDPALKTAPLPKLGRLISNVDGAKHVLGPEGKAISEADLPKQPGRWTARLKAMVIAAVEGNLITLDEALRRYNVSAEEFGQWRRHYFLHGRKGLRVTHLQEYRQRT